ncbi:translocation/assembly module TamB domain-containing protein [Altibacter sp. HG106]|uniref:translocation/assembly module TamB domain-containing protein n=1 Tax=Altibacter sp. HG106 TaxID=3023937 RepID=UPI002350E3C8|nr:translocation/assembly module TamB [Altibacter sp. HG106]MDC7993485.1 translocation/assembly module TamB domain-containing protein [Altibacter sp. HG106]
MILLLLIIIVFSIPAVQTYVAKKVTDDLNETYGTDINIHRLGLNWKGEVDVREVYIADHHQDTLIYAKRLQTNILSFQNLIRGDLGFGNIDLEEAKLYVKTYQGEAADNLYIFSEKFNTGQPPSENPFSLFSNDVTLTNSKVKITDENLDTPEIFNLDQVNITADDFKITGPNIDVNILDLSMVAQRGFTIEALQSKFSYSLEKMVMDDLYLKTTHSTIQGNIILDYAESGMADFQNNVTITASFDDTQIGTNDINAFYDEFGPNQTLYLDGLLEGTLNDFRFTEGAVAYGNTRMSGTFRFQNLISEENNIRIDARNHYVRANYYDLRRLMPRVLGNSLPEVLKEFNSMTLQGNTVLNGDELTTTSIFNSGIGNADLDVTIGNFNDVDNAFYDGKIKLDKLNLGTLANTSSLGTITANVEVNGRGFSQNTVNTRVSGSISAITFEDYTYQNITLSGTLRNPVFNGSLRIDDPNVKLRFDGLVDVSKEFNQYDFEADVEYAELNTLNLFTRDSISVFSGRVIMDMDGTTINDAAGTIEFVQTFYQNEEEDYYFDDFLIISSFDGPERTIEIISPDIIDGKITGEFLIEDIPNLFRNGIGSIYANYIPNEVTVDQYLNYEFEVYNKIVEVFVPQLQLGENTRVQGSVASDESEFIMNFRSPMITVFDNYLEKVNIQVDNDNPLYNAYISIDSIDAGFYGAKDFNLINKTLNDTLYVRSEFKGGTEGDDIFNLSLYHTINPAGKSVVGVRKSDVTFKDNVWYINEENNDLNKVVFDDNFSNVRIDSLVISHENESIQLAGEVRDTDYKNIKAQFNNVDIGKITPEVDSLDLRGNVNGTLQFLEQNGAYYPNSSVVIDNVVINDIPFGDLDLFIEGNEDLTQYAIDISLLDQGKKPLSAVGTVDVAPENPQIDLTVTMDAFNLQAFSPFGGDVITNIRGFATGNARVTGNYKSPNIDGRIDLANSGLTIPYLNVDFDISNNTPVFISKNALEIRPTNITDTKYNTVGTLMGSATHDNFGDWELDMNITTNRLLVLDTPPDEDALYYGTAFISGAADITGPVDDLAIDVLATTESGTTFKIPLDDTEAIGDDSFIRFLSPEEKEARIRGETIFQEEVKGLSLNFDLDITDEAEVEVVVDKVNNSTLKGRGAGTLLIRINTNGKFQMWGEFTVIEGNYDFRYSGIIQKEFEVVPGGFIVWEGDPIRGRLDLSAKYKTTANPSVLLDNPGINRKIPVEVIVDLNGQIIQPDLAFQIEFPEASSIVRSELEYKLQNREQRQTQALFLVSTGSFQSDAAAVQNSIAGTLAERVNAIVADIFADSDSKFKVLPYYQPATRTVNQETADQLGVQFSTNISERVLINGTVGVPVGGVNESTVAGDIEVQWLLNQDGSLRLNFFNRQADIQFIGEDQIFEQGVGASYSVDFDTFRELIRKLFNKELTLESELQPVVPDDNEIPETFPDSNSDGIIEEND